MWQAGCQPGSRGQPWARDQAGRHSGPNPGRFGSQAWLGERGASDLQGSGIGDQHGPWQEAAAAALADAAQVGPPGGGEGSGQAGVGDVAEAAAEADLTEAAAEGDLTEASAAGGAQRRRKRKEEEKKREQDPAPDSGLLLMGGLARLLADQPTPKACPMPPPCTVGSFTAHWRPINITTVAHIFVACQA